MKPWDQFWTEYHMSEAEEYYIEWRDSILQRLVAGLSIRPFTVLEAGCGYGSNIRRLQKAGVEGAVAMDLSFNAVLLAHSEVNRATVADLRDLPFSKGVFDLVFNAGVVEHFPDPMIPLGEMLRLTKPGGWVCAFVPGTFNLWQLYRKLKGAHWEHGFEQAFSMAQMTQFAERLGLCHIRAGGVDSFTLKGVLLKLAKVRLPFEMNAGFGYQEVYVYGQKPVA